VSNPTKIMQLRDTLQTEFEGMTTGAGYNFTYSKVIRALINPDDIKDPLHLGFYLGRRQFNKLDDQRTLFTKDVSVVVQVVKQLAKKPNEENTEADDAQELIINDIERKISEFMTTYINHATNPWNVSFDKEPLTEYPMIVTNEEIAKLTIIFEFNIKLRRLKGATD
jgi:hypothetical protein